jgi:hypothetical protein
MAKGISNTSRTLEYIRSQGWIADKVEQFNRYAGEFGKRKDMFGFADIVAMGEGKIIAIQSCGQAFSEHERKILDDEEVAAKALKWMECGGRLLLIGWRKLKLHKGGKAMRWTPRIREFQREDFISEGAGTAEENLRKALGMETKSASGEAQGVRG